MLQLNAAYICAIPKSAVYHNSRHLTLFSNEKHDNDADVDDNVDDVIASTKEIICLQLFVIRLFVLQDY